MPAWLAPILFNTALRLGLAFLVKQFPGIPTEIKQALEDFLKEIKEPHVSNSVAKKKAMAKIKACYGVGCPTGLKGE